MKTVSDSDRAKSRTMGGTTASGGRKRHNKMSDSSDILGSGGGGYGNGIPLRKQLLEQLYIE